MSTFALSFCILLSTMHTSIFTWQIYLPEPRPNVINVKFVNRGFCRIKYLGVSSSVPDNIIGNINVVECAMVCAKDISCVGFNFLGSGRGKCSVWRETGLLLEDCSDENATEIFMQKDEMCLNAGEWSTDTNSCDCALSRLIGDYCSVIPVACDDYLTAGYESATESIERDRNGIEYNAHTFCLINIQKKVSTAIFAKFEPTHLPLFNRKWLDMENGFHNGSTFWVGLQAMYHHMERVKHKARYLRITFQRFKDPRCVFKYHGIHLSDASDGFRLTYQYSECALLSGGVQTSCNRNVGVPDCMLPANGSRFSTYDRDQDEDNDENCAARSKAGFWYSKCRPWCHPLAVSFDSTRAQPFPFTSLAASPFPLSSSTYLWAGNVARTEIDLVVFN